jgi:glycosyltransferase involved in cell wall biosynthesis
VQHGISVVIPVFNAAHVLERAVRSVREQSGFAPEIVVVNDGSTDETPALLRRILAEDMKILTQANAGPGAARNAGILASRGEWIAFLDADDWWLPGKLASQMSAIASDPEAAFCTSDAMIRDAGGHECVRKFSSFEDTLFLNLLRGPAFGTGSVVIRRRCFDLVGYFDPLLRTGEDWDMWLRLAAKFHGCHVPKPLCVYQHVGRLDKYPAKLMESCTLRVIGRVFSNPAILQRWPDVAKHRRRIYSWHCSVLAKTYLRQKKWGSCLRLALTSIAWNPIGAYYLFRSWGHSDLPCLVPGGPSGK